MQKSIGIISLSKIASDGRVLRQIEYLSRQYDVVVIGYGEAPDYLLKSSNIHWHEIKLCKQPIFRSLQTVAARLLQIPFFPMTHEATRIAIESRCDAYHANNWDALPAAAIAARTHGSKLVMDIHESYDTWYWGLSKGIIRFVFQKFSSYVDSSTTVVQQIADQHQEFGLNPIVLRNIPEIPAEPITLKKTDGRKIRLISHGVASKERRTDLMIKTLALCDPQYELHLVFTNFKSAYVTGLRKLAEKITPGRVFFHPPYAPKEIVSNIMRFDVGIHPIAPTSYNNIIALPNKFFEFIAAGLAVCIGPSPSMAEIVKEYHCGVIATSFEAADIAEVLNRTTAAQWDEMKQASLRASQELNADHEMKKLIDIYQYLFRQS